MQSVYVNGCNPCFEMNAVLFVIFAAEFGKIQDIERFFGLSGPDMCRCYSDVRKSWHPHQLGVKCSFLPGQRIIVSCIVYVKAQPIHTNTI